MKLTNEQATTLRELENILKVATLNGLLDQLSTEYHPDTVNQFCDMVTQASCPPETEREDAAARGQPVIPSAIDAIMSDVCDLPGNYDPADPNVVMMTLDELHAILESHLK